MATKVNRDTSKVTSDVTVIRVIRVIYSLGLGFRKLG
jgi:hypothetical protein